MKVRIEEKNGISITLKIFYAVIIFICIASVIMAIHLQMESDKENNENPAEISQEESNDSKEKFNNMFNNKVNYLSGNSYKITKIEQKESIIYTGYKMQEEKANSYSLDVNIPYINIKNDKIQSYNEQINEIFEKKTKNILNSQNNNTIYTVNYSAYISNNILSLVVKSTLKEGSNPQRDIVQTYNYDLTEKQECGLDKFLELKGLSKQDANKKIREEIKEAQEKAEKLAELGYPIYNRDYESEIYNINNVTEYFMGEDKSLYIIYAYGNENFTDELDIVIL